MRSNSPVSRISNKLQNITAYTVDKEVKTSSLQQIMKVNQLGSYAENEVPQSKLPFALKTTKFPSQKPFQREERAWFLQLVQNQLQNQLDQSKSLELISQFQFELARHLENAYKIPIQNQNINPFSELVLVSKKLSEFVFDIAQNLLIDNIEKYSSELHQNDQTNKQFLLETQKKELQIEYDSIVTTLQIEKQKISALEFQAQEIRKQRDDKQQINGRLSQKISTMQDQLLEKDHLILQLQQQKSSAIIVNDIQQIQKTLPPRPHSSINSSNILRNTGSLYDSKIKNKQFLEQQDVLSAYSGGQNQDLTKFQSASNDQDESTLTSYLNQSQSNQQVLKQFQDKTHVIDPLEAQMDLIPISQKVSYNPNYKVQVPQQQGYSRLEQAEIMMADGEKIENVENIFDSQFPANQISCNYDQADIINLNQTDFNPITKEIISIKKRIIPQNINEQNVIFSAQKIVDNIADQAEDDSYNIEMKVLAMQSQDQPENKAFSSFYSYSKDQFAFQSLKLSIQQHRKCLSHYISPILTDTSQLLNSDLQIEFPSQNPLLKSIQCIQLQNSAVQSVLGSNSSGGIINFFQATSSSLKDKTDQINIKFQGPGCITQNDSIFGANFSTAQKNPFNQIQDIDQDWNIVKGGINENCDQEVQTDLSISKFFMEYLKKNKLSPQIVNLVMFYIKHQLASKTSSFNLIGLKNKPGCQIMKIIDQQSVQQLIQLMTGQDFDKLINENVIKKNAQKYKDFANISACKKQEQIQSLCQIIQFNLTEDLFGLNMVRKIAKQKQFTLYTFNQLIQQIDIIFVARQQFQAKIKDNSIYQRVYIEFIPFLYNFLLENNQYDKQKTDRVIISISFSLTIYITFLGIQDEKTKNKNIIVSDHNEEELLFLNGCASCQVYLLTIFHQILNEQFSNQDIEFIIYTYNIIRKISQYTGTINYSFISQEIAQISVTKIFSQLQVAGISGFMRTVIDDVIQQINKYTIEINADNIIIDIGKVIYICLKCKEQLCNHFISTTIHKFEKLDSITFEEYAKVMMSLVPKMNPQYPPVFDMFKAIYTSVLLKNGQVSIKNILVNPDFYISQNVNNFELQVYDYYSQFIPVLKLNKLFYSLNDVEIISVTKLFTQTIDTNINDVELSIKQITQQLVSNGLGLSPIFEPFLIPDSSEQTDFRVISNPDAKLTFLDQRRPESLMIGKSISLLFLSFKQASQNNQLLSVQLLQQTLCNAIRSISTLRPYQTTNKNSQQKRIDLINFYTSILKQISAFIMKNTYTDEIRSALGVDFDESIISDVDRLLMLSRNFTLTKQ